MQRCSLQLDVSGREQAGASVAVSLPPAFIDHLDVGDYIIGVEGNFIIRLCRQESMRSIRGEMTDKCEEKKKKRWCPYLPRSRKVLQPSGHMTGLRSRLHV